MKNKTCMICKLGIDVKKEQFVKVEHYENEGKILSKGWYHIKCYRDRLNGTEKTKQLQEQTLGLIKGIREMTGIRDKQEVAIL